LNGLYALFENVEAGCFCHLSFLSNLYVEISRKHYRTPRRPTHCCAAPATDETGNMARCPGRRHEQLVRGHSKIHIILVVAVAPMLDAGNPLFYPVASAGQKVVVAMVGTVAAALV
jgi:hypothetical protein